MKTNATLLMLCMVVVPWVAHSQAATVEVAPFSVSAAPGTPAFIDIQVSSAEQIAAVQFTIEYNSSIMSFGSVVAGADLPNGFAITNVIHNLVGGTTAPDTDSNVLVQILGSGVNWFTGDNKSVAHFTFDVLPDACGMSVVAFDPACQRTHLSTLQLVTICNPEMVAGEVVTDACATDVAPHTNNQIRLMQNRPNPFNPSTTIPFELDRAGHVTLRVFDLRGRHVRTLLDRSLGSGPHQVPWNGRDASNQRLPTGIYYYELSTRGATVTKRSVLVK